MGFDQQVAAIFRVLRDDDGCWNVLANDFEEPLASFEDRQDACDYANRLAEGRQGASVVMLDESNPAPDQAGPTMRP